MENNSTFSDFIKMVSKSDFQISTGVLTKVTDLSSTSLHQLAIELVHVENLKKCDDSRLKVS